MPITISNATGDGLTTSQMRTNIQLPDSGTTVQVNGVVRPALPAAAQNNNPVPAVTITGSPLTIPAPPGSGSIFYNIQVDVVTGAAVVVQSTVSDPAPALSSDGVTPKVVIFRQTLTNASSANPTLNPSTTPSLP